MVRTFLFWQVFLFSLTYSSLFDEVSRVMLNVLGVCVQNEEDELSKKQLSALQLPTEPFTGSAVEWVLKKADRSLDEIEDNPPPYAKALYEVSNGPVGKTASKGVQTAAKMTLEVGAGALKAAAPVGKWVLQQGAKAAVAAVKKAITSSPSDKNKNS